MGRRHIVSVGGGVFEGGFGSYEAGLINNAD